MNNIDRKHLEEWIKTVHNRNKNTQQMFEIAQKYGDTLSAKAYETSIAVRETCVREIEYIIKHYAF